MGIIARCQRVARRLLETPIGDAILGRLIHNAYQLNLKGESRRKVNSPLTMPTT